MEQQVYYQPANNGGFPQQQPIMNNGVCQQPYSAAGWYNPNVPPTYNNGIAFGNAIPQPKPSSTSKDELQRLLTMSGKAFTYTDDDKMREGWDLRNDQGEVLVTVLNSRDKRVRDALGNEFNIVDINDEIIKKFIDLGEDIIRTEKMASKDSNLDQQQIKQIFEAWGCVKKLLPVLAENCSNVYNRFLSSVNNSNGYGNMYPVGYGAFWNNRSYNPNPAFIAGDNVYSSNGIDIGYGYQQPQQPIMNNGFCQQPQQPIMNNGFYQQPQQPIMNNGFCQQPQQPIMNNGFYQQPQQPQQSQTIQPNGGNPVLTNTNVPVPGQPMPQPNPNMTIGGGQQPTPEVTKATTNV